MSQVPIPEPISVYKYFLAQCFHLDREFYKLLLRAYLCDTIETIKGAIESFINCTYVVDWIKFCSLNEYNKKDNVICESMYPFRNTYDMAWRYAKNGEEKKSVCFANLILENDIDFLKSLYNLTELEYITFFISQKIRTSCVNIGHLGKIMKNDKVIIDAIDYVVNEIYDYKYGHIEGKYNTTTVYPTTFGCILDIYAPICEYPMKQSLEICTIQTLEDLDQLKRLFKSYTNNFNL